MNLDVNEFSKEFYTDFNIFHELMKKKIWEILLVSSPYDAFIMEEDGSLASKFVNEYRGLNLSRPPRLTRASSGREALKMLADKKEFQLVITMSNISDMDPFTLGAEIKKHHPDLPVALLSHSARGLFTDAEGATRPPGIDKIFIWTGNSNILLALVKSVEDKMNVDADTEKAKVRVLMLVEDSPTYRSVLLPLVYKVVVKQTQAIIDESLNEEHRLLKMRARPKILVAESYEEAMDLYNRYHPYIFGVISDTRFPKGDKMHDDAGAILLAKIKKEVPHLPVLLYSSDPDNRKKADAIPAEFLDKNSPNLHENIREFFLNFLGFGDFVFRKPGDREISRASTLRLLEKTLPTIPDEPIEYQARRNRFSNWLMARSEISLASRLAKIETKDFETTAEMRQFLVSSIHALRKARQKGVVTQFNSVSFDPDIMDFAKIGRGSLGGKARGLAFLSDLLRKGEHLHDKYPGIEIKIPRTLVIAADLFESFVRENDLSFLVNISMSDESIIRRFVNADFPPGLAEKLEAFLSKVHYPLSVRSSSLLEDAQFQPYAGLYETFMIPNNHPDMEVRLERMIMAVKRVYASTYFENPKAFTRNVSNQPHEEAMAVAIQELAGRRYGDYFYPAISGVAQSRNFYPVSRMKSDDGIAHIGLGLGKIVMEGEQALRFCPRHPKILPQFSTVKDIMDNAQRYFYALKVRDVPGDLDFKASSNLEKRDVDAALEDFPIRTLASTYVPGEDRIRDSGYMPGPKVLTFAQVLKYNLIPLPELLSDLLDMGRESMGCPVEIEFSVNLAPTREENSEFHLLQMRPMATGRESFQVSIDPGEIEKAFCYSTRSLGNGEHTGISDIVYVKPDRFRPEATVRIAGEIGDVNAGLLKEDRKYLLVGPGRWGSSDHWLGIPVQWKDISSVGAIVELRNNQLKVDPSHGSHFFQNITSLGIHYITVTEDEEDFFNWGWASSQQVVQDLEFLRHIRLENPFLLKIDGRESTCVMMEHEET
ncbi:MAG: phosphoenolpyruvate synthase/pyruvate phosphate dikinase [Desulfobacterales bacterium]|nr:phosphoenolpyruvate synthase/pyruvate phosphate dikinase [Desulfobacterales bacterium]